MIATDQENLLGIYNLESKKNSNHLPCAGETPVFIPNKQGFRSRSAHPKMSKGRASSWCAPRSTKSPLKTKLVPVFAGSPKAWKNMSKSRSWPWISPGFLPGECLETCCFAQDSVLRLLHIFQQTKDSTIVTCTIGDSKPTEDGSKDSTWLRGLNNRLILSYNPTCTASQNHQAVRVICTLGDTIVQKIRKSQTSSPSNKNSHDIDYFHSQQKNQGTEKKTESIFVPVCMQDISLFLSDLSLTQSAWDLGFTDSPPVLTDPPCTHPRNHKQDKQNKILDTVCFLHFVSIMLPVMCRQFVLLSAGADDVTCWWWFVIVPMSIAVRTLPISWSGALKSRIESSVPAYLQWPNRSTLQHLEQVTRFTNSWSWLTTAFALRRAPFPPCFGTVLHQHRLHGVLAGWVGVLFEV